MPWLETDPMVERHHVAPDLASGWWTMTARWARYGIRRNTGYHWRERFLARGVPGWLAHRRAPRSSPNETSPETIALILAEHPRDGWGARKMLTRRQPFDPTVAWPARRTIVDSLARHARAP